MTINSETRVAGPFEGNDSTVAFPFAFKVFDSDELLVVRAADAIETVLTLGTDYSVTLNPDQNASPGGVVTLAVALATDATLTLTSDLEYLQPLDLTNQGGFYPRVINNAFDRVTILLQQLRSIVGRTLKFPLSDGPVGDLPGRAARAGSVLAFDNATGEPIVGPNIAAVGTVAAAVEAINTVAPHVGAIEIVADNILDVTNFADVYYGPSATDPTTRRDGTPLQEGDLYFNTSSGSIRAYSGSGVWVAPTSGGIEVHTFEGNGSTVAFDLGTAPLTERNSQVYISGVYQQKDQYTVTGSVLTFNVAPPDETTVEVVTLSTLPYGEVADTVLRGELANGTDSLVDAAVVEHLQMSVAGYLEQRVSATAYGLKTTNTGAQNAAAMQSACAASRNIFVPEGDYACGPFFPRAGTRISGSGPLSILRQTVPATLLLPDGSVSKQIGLIHVDSGSASVNVTGLVVEDLQLIGRSVSNGFSEFVHLISLNGARSVFINRVFLTSFQGDAIYLGVGGGDSTERHNFDVYISHCVIDGVNNDNRNALSIVDGVNVHFSHNKVRNCTRSNMPGAVDVEPQNQADTARDIYISDNNFEAVGGTSGVVGYYVVANTYIRPQSNLRFERNTIRSCSNAGGAWGAKYSGASASASTAKLGILIKDNKVFDCSRVGVFTGIHGLTHSDNDYMDTNYGMFLGMPVNGGNYLIETSGNRYTRPGKSNAVDAGYGIQVSTNSFLKIHNEEFIDCGKQDGTLGYPLYFVDGSSDNVSIKGIITRNISGKTTYSIKALGTHNFSAESNTFEENLLRVTGNDFKWKAGMYSTFTLATLPLAMPEGVTYFTINGDPSFTLRSVVKTEKFRDPVDGSYVHTIIQWIIPSSSTAEGNAVYFRKPDPVSGGWSPVKKLTGL